MKTNKSLTNQCLSPKTMMFSTKALLYNSKVLIFYTKVLFSILIFTTALFSGLTNNLSAKTWSCTNSTFEVDGPDNWPGKISSSKTSVKIESPEIDEFSIIIKGKKNKKALRAKQIIGMFKKRWKEINAEFPKSTILQKPEKTTAGDFAAIKYAFRYKNFLGTVIDETEIWFNPKNDSTSLTANIKVKGMAKSLKKEEVNTESIIASFRFMGQPDEPSKPVKDTEPVYVATYTSTTKTPPHSDSSRKNESTKYAAINNQGQHTLKKNVLNIPITGSRRRPAGNSLMSDAKLITDPEKLRQYKKTFQDRNFERTAEQRAKARLYSGGFGNAQVE